MNNLKVTDFYNFSNIFIQNIQYTFNAKKNAKNTAQKISFNTLGPKFLV